uniref:Uncharacterized protein n=1 Tax=Tanacetum cinerariifolium TaxID=118510 RepID=A0A6L2J708_TANCI|nr:hypothetical protein [Tanacetum cinerariifolium]
MAKGEIDNLTMEQYLALTRGNQATGVVKTKMGGNVNFEIKSQFMRELREDTFSGNKNDDAHEHVDRVLDIVGLFNILGVTHDEVMLRVFPLHSLEPLKGGWIDFPHEPSIPSISLKRPLSKGTVHHQRSLNGFKKSVTLCRKRKKENSLLLLFRILRSLFLEPPPPTPSAVVAMPPPTAAAVFFLCSWFSRFEGLGLVFGVSTQRLGCV